MLLEQVVMMQRCHSDAHVATAHRQEEIEQQEVAEVLKTDTVVDPRAVMVHQEGALVADLAVVGPCRLDLAAFVTALRPEVFQLGLSL